MQVPPGEVAAVEAALPRGLDEAAALARDVGERERRRRRGGPGRRRRPRSRRRSRGGRAGCARPSRPAAGARSARAPRASARARATTSRSVTVTSAAAARRSGRLTPSARQLAADVDVRDLLPARGDVRDDGRAEAVVGAGGATRPLRGRRRRRGRAPRSRPPGPEPRTAASSTPSLAGDAPSGR